MMNKREKLPLIVLGAALCLAALVVSVVLQQTGYVTYLNSDMASETILANWQAQRGSLIEMDWLYSTEIHSLHMNLFYALAFLFTPDYMMARIIGNTMVFVLGMASLVCLLRTLRCSWGASLVCAAMLPATASTLYASNMTIGGYYIIHLPFAFLPPALWLSASQEDWKGARKRFLSVLIAYTGLCLLMGLLSVRYVLCFVCPMVVVAGLEWMLAPRAQDHIRLLVVSLCGFAACVLGYAASEVIYPRLFTSGTGGADSFVFNPLDGPMMLNTLSTVFADFLKLLGWRSEAPLFSVGGVVNLLVTAVLVCGAIMLWRVCRCLNAQAGADEEAPDAGGKTARIRRQMIRYALAALMVNLFCFVFIKGTYLNRYLILAVLFLIPVTLVVVGEEKNARLRRIFVLCLCVHLASAGMLLLKETSEHEKQTRLWSADLMSAGEYLLQEGYTHGYGTFWNIRVLQERTQGALTMTSVSLVETEEGAPVALGPDLSRWLEPSAYSDLDKIRENTFLLLTSEESRQLSAWLEMTDAPVIYENDTYVVYGFDGSKQIQTWMLLGKMKLENARFEDGGFVMEANARMRIPTSWREKGEYTLRFAMQGTPQADSMVRLYTTSSFTLLKEAPLLEGENEIVFSLPQDDKYFMILFVSGSAESLRVEQVELAAAQ